MCTFIQIPTIYGRLNFSVHKFCCVGAQCCFDRSRVREGPPVPAIKRVSFLPFFLNRRLYPRGHLPPENKGTEGGGLIHDAPPARKKTIPVTRCLCDGETPPRDGP